MEAPVTPTPTVADEGVGNTTIIIILLVFIFIIVIGIYIAYYVNANTYRKVDPNIINTGLSIQDLNGRILSVNVGTFRYNNNYVTYPLVTFNGIRGAPNSGWTIVESVEKNSDLPPNVKQVSIRNNFTGMSMRVFNPILQDIYITIGPNPDISPRSSPSNLEYWFNMTKTEVTQLDGTVSLQYTFESLSEISFNRPGRFIQPGIVIPDQNQFISATIKKASNNSNIFNLIFQNTEKAERETNSK